MDDRIFNRRQLLSTAGVGIVGLGMSGRAAAAPGDPNEEYLELIAQQQDLRNNEPDMDEEAVRSILRERQDEFDGHLLFFAANDFGQPRAFLPESLSDQDAALQAVLNGIHERKWGARNAGLRDVRDRTFDEVRGVHKGFGAVYHDGGSVDYDIEYPTNAVYNFLTIRQVVGLVDWLANAGEPWLDGRRPTY